MASIKTVKEIMVDAFEYPHIPYWFSIKQAVGIINKSFIETETCIRPMAVLVFDEKYNLVGTVTLRNILKGLESEPSQPLARAADEGVYLDETTLARYEAGMFSEESKKLAEKPVEELLTPVKVFVSPEDSALKAAFVMVNHNMTILPVLENRKKLVGLVRMIEVFKEVSSIVSK